MLVSLAGCVIVDKKGRIGLLHRKKQGFVHWELPGGKVETGETKEEAAQRELQEELGIKVKIVRRLGSSKFSDSHGAFNYVWFKAIVVKGKPTIKEPKLFDNFAYFTIEELDSLTLSANMQKLFPMIKSKQIVL